MRSKPQGLFDGLLGGEPAVLLQDASENPDKYDDETVELLHDLVQGTKKKADLKEADTRLLDLATFTFSSYVKPKAPKPVERPRRAPDEKLAEEIENGLFEDDMDVPEGTPDYWWL